MMKICTPNPCPAQLSPSQHGEHCMRGAGVEDPGWAVGEEEGTREMLSLRHGWESPGSRLCQHSAGKQSSFSSLLPAFLVPAPTGKGRKEGEHPHPSRARVQTYSLSWEGVSLCSWEGEINREPLLTHPNTALLARGHVENGLCRWFKSWFPSQGCQEAIV